MLRNAIRTRKQVRVCARWGVGSAENNFGCSVSGSKSLPAVIADQYTRIMPKITKQRSKRKTPTLKGTKAAWGKLAANPRPNRAATAGAAAKSAKSKAAKKSGNPWTPAEVHEAFTRF